MFTLVTCTLYGTHTIINSAKTESIIPQPGVHKVSIFSTDKQSDIVVKEELKEPSLYNVVVHNNDHTSYDEVIIILMQAFQLSADQALDIATKVDTEGQGICGTYSREVADMKLLVIDVVKRQLIQTYPGRANQINMLKFTIEKAD